MAEIDIEKVAELITLAQREQTAALTEFWRLLHQKEEKVIFESPTLAAAQRTELKDCLPICAQFIRYLGVTASARLHVAATASVRIHILTSTGDGIWDTADFTSFDLPLDAGTVVQKTVALSPDALYYKVSIENLDSTYPAQDIKVTVIY